MQSLRPQDESEYASSERLPLDDPHRTDSKSSLSTKINNLRAVL